METFLEKLENATTKLNQYVERPTIVKQASAYYHLKESMTHSGIYPKPIAQQKFFQILKHIKSLGFNFDATVMSAMDGATVNLENQLKSLESHVSGSSNKTIISWEYFERLPDIDCCNTIDQPDSESVFKIKEGTPMMDILERLSLSDYFPGKLSLQSVLSINDIKFAGARLISDIPWAILHEIIAVNFNFREKVLSDFVKNSSSNQEDEDDDDLLSGQIEKNINNTDTFDFHPLDVFMAIFQCCDPFLKRVVAQKISLCQLALPYVFEDYSSGNSVLSLWPLRDIYIDSISESVATQVLKTVSFLRIGEGLTKSKSRIINEFLRDINEEHSTFFHRDCKLGMNTRIITNGMIEASWYVPAQPTNTAAGSEGAKKLQSEERLTVLNLRGDAYSLHGQLKTLLKLTNVVVVLISAEDIQKAIYSETLKIIHSSNCSVILLTNLSMTVQEIKFLQTYKREKAIESGKTTKVVTTFLKKQKRHMNQDELQNLVRKNIFSMIKDIDQGIKIEEMVTKLEINSDENSKNYRMKAKAADIHSKIKKFSEASNRKQIILPLQGEKLWQDWSKKQKEQKRPQSQEAKYNPEETLLKDMQQLRRQQVEACNKSPDVMAEFIHVLVEIIHDNEAISFFLFWMRQFLDDESRIEIPKKQDEFLEAFEKYESTEKKSRENKQRIDDIEKKIAHASFGLEHFFREIGQIYEAFLYSKEDKNCTIAVESQQIISLLPMVAAKLLLLGQPLELMDGDAANVPLKWIKAVFREIKDMQDVLQIVIHGLMRIKQVNKDLHLRQSSMFVHQNVSAENAKKQMIQGNKKIVENLDRMTNEVASQEQFENISSFKDVIKFDPTKDVRFVPDLWHGARKMALASPEYSCTVKVVAEDLLDIASSKKRSFLSIENTVLYFESLWNGILAEYFVFSFRNCLEVKAYSLLELEYQKFNFSLNMLKHEWIYDNVKPKLSFCKEIEELESVSKTLYHKFQQKLKIKKDEAEKNLTTFIEQSEFSDYMILWKENKKNCLRSKADSLKNEMEVHIRTEKEKSSIAISHGNLLVTKEAQINEKAKDVALSLIDKDLTHSKMREKFEELWTQWITELVPEGAVDKTKERIEQMKRDIQNILDERCPTQHSLIKDGLKKHPLDTPVYTGSLQNSITVADIKPEHFKIVKTFTKMKNMLFSVNKEVDVVKVINIILSNIDVMFDDMSKTDADYENTHFSRILEIVINGIERQNETTNHGVKLKPSLEIFVVLHVSRYSYNRYKEIIRCYEKKHNIMTSLLKYKPQAQRLFIDVCEAKSQEMQATHALCNYLKDLIKEKVERNIYRKIQTEINKMYFSQKSSLMKEIMEELADKNDFERYMRYIQSPACYVFEWITEMTNDAVFHKLPAGDLSLYVKWTNNDTITIVDYIKDAVDATTNVFNEKQELDIEKWKSAFVEQISKQNLLLTSTTFEHVKGYKIKSFKEFRKNVKKELSEMETQLITEFNQTLPESIKWPTPTPYQCIFDTLWGCKETCPFCSEPCQRAQANHASTNDNHTCIQHRCTAANGHSWTDSGKLTIESCNFDVQSTSTLRCGKWCKCPNTDTCKKNHPFKDYKTYFPEWNIESSTNTSRSDYWNWFVATYCSELAKYYGKELPDIPKTWYNITKGKAIQSLNDVFPTL